MKPKQPTRPLREQIAAYLATVEEATAAEIAKHTTERNYPSRVINELSKMRTDALVETGKKGRDLSYWLASTGAPSAPAEIPTRTTEGAERRRQIIRAAISGKTSRNGPSLKDLATACGITGQAVENLVGPMISSGTVGKARAEGERFQRFFDTSTQAIAPPQPEVGHNTGSDGSAVIVPDASTEAVAVQEPAPKPEATRATVAEDVKADEMYLLNVLADIRTAMGDAEGRLMQDELAPKIAEMARDADELHRARNTLATIREILSPFPVGIDPASITVEGLAEHAAAAIRDGLDRIFSKSADDGAVAYQTAIAQRDAWRDMAARHECETPSALAELMTVVCADRDDALADLANARALNDKLQHLLESKTHECEGLRVNLAAALDTVKSVAKGDEAADVLEAAAAYLVRAPKRRPRILTKPQSARAAALAAVRNGAGRADVFTLVHVGSARRGAEWKEPQ